MMENSLETWGPVCASVGVAVTGLAATYYLTKMPEPTCIPPVDLDNQSHILQDGSRTSKLVPKDAKYKPLYEDVETFYDIFQRGIKTSGNGPFLGTRSGPNQEYVWLSYQEVYDQSVAFGSWMLEQGIQSRSETVIGIFSQNRAEWVITEKACVAYSLVPVALYDTLGDDAVTFIINQTNMSLIVCDVSEKVNKILKMVSEGENRCVKTIVVMNGIDGVDAELAWKVDVMIVPFQDALKTGCSNLKPVAPPTPEDLALICYTSGTTGNPKGVMITYKQAMAQITGLSIAVFNYRLFNKNDVHLSYLPLAHMYERIGQQCLTLEGARIGFFRGDVKLLLDDLQTLKPTVFFSVPRLLNRIYDKVMAGVKGSKLKVMLFNWAIASKENELKQYVIRRNSIWDKIVFQKIQALFGGRVEYISTGSAPLEAKVLTFFRCALGCMILEAYGQTESVAGLTMGVPGDYHAGAVGPPIPYNYIKLLDAPEYGYFAKDNQGEVCAKGVTISSGYYKDPVKTSETFDKDGWLHTGDIGQWLPNGTLIIIDRKKNLFKLSQGEYVAPEKVELVYIRSSFVAQAFVEGDSLQPYVMSVIVPDEEVLMAWAKSQKITGSFQDLCKSESVKTMILLDIQKIGREAGLKGFELTKDIVVRSELFSVENGLLTPTFKNKRPQLRSFFKNDIAALYKKHQGSSS
ncbi:long-chain-fatty-acid--CoA ligase 1-like isoform X1 [Mercenaria mercenaria]|uniref:long-chain-fatty-acid--CoA ligase 1-like isoform X1 n=2 Tax=Mercenaria mercenaria TaxID=6596 RepID=UPI00234F2258|nr:long-chain-fatty-acid--CoA ligase 1-like isoform X1 [Mercenaria mercenaria]